MKQFILFHGKDIVDHKLKRYQALEKLFDENLDDLKDENNTFEEEYYVELINDTYERKRISKEEYEKGIDYVRVHA